MKTFRFALFLAVYQLLLTLGVQADVQDVGIFGVIKQQTFVQESDKIAKLIEEKSNNSGNSNNTEDVPLAFNLFLDLNEGGSIISATVTPPGGGTLTLTSEGDNYNFSYAAEHLLDLNTQHPNGTYTFNIVTDHNGTLTVPLTLTGDTYPSVPRVSNYGAAQTINPAQNFTLTWDAFSGGTAGDFIEIFIEEDNSSNEVFHSGSPGSGLDGTDTSILIPAGTLEAGKRYHVEIMFAKLVQTANPGGATAVAAYTKRTLLHIQTTGTSLDFSNPNLNSSKPYNGETSVPVKSVVAFNFNEPMDTGFISIEWSGSGLDPDGFTYTWSFDSRTLFATYTGSLPPSTQIFWTLNPAESEVTMQDVAGNPLFMNSGSFTTSSSAASGDPDVRNILLIKSQALFQSGSTPTALNRYQFEVIGDLNTFNGVLNGTVTTPGAGVVRPENDFYGTTYDYEADYASKTDLERFFANGAYSISLNTAHNGTKNISLTFPADNYPNDPTLASFSSLQNIDPGQNLTVSWGAYSGANGSDSFFIQLFLETDDGEEVYQSPEAGESGALLGTSTSVVIPANTLSPGREYQGELVFARVVAADTSTYSGATFRAVFAKVTKFTVQTTGSPIQPTLTFTKGNPAQVGVTGDKHVSYVLEASSNFQSWYAVSYSQSTYDGTTTSFYDYDVAYFSKRFYRVKEVPGNQNAHRPVSIQGTVYQSGNSNPIAGATVSTTLSGTTTETDSNGNFFLQTDVILSDYYQSYGIMVNKGGYQTYSLNSQWGETPRNLQIYLNLDVP